MSATLKSVTRHDVSIVVVSDGRGRAESAQMATATHFVPDVSHARRDQVYEVSEDTLLLADSIEKDAALLRQLRPALCLESGAGSGYVSAVLAHTLQAPALCFATDINTAAACATSLTMRKNPPPFGLFIAFAFKFVVFAHWLSSCFCTFMTPKKHVFVTLF